MTHKNIVVHSESIICQEWPEQDLESVCFCPMCESERRTLVYSRVNDWTFACAPGCWNYWRCDSCDTLYLDARPTEASIGRAYVNYYTHSDAQSDSTLLRKCALRVAVAIKRGFLNFSLGTNLLDSIALPKFVYRILGKVELLPRSFLHDIQYTKPGRMLDLGCGDGRLMLLAKSFGWDVVGIEVDNAAVQTARKKGLEVQFGSYKDIAGLNKKFNLIVCSHVIEHIHLSRKLLSLALASLEDGGQLWLQWPNPKSDGLKRYGVHWRGLEAPRHLCLPSIDSIKRLTKLNDSSSFVVTDNSIAWKWAQMSMYEASENIKKGRIKSSAKMNLLRAILRFLLTRRNVIECELCTITIKKNTSRFEDASISTT